MNYKINPLNYSRTKPIPLANHCRLRLLWCQPSGVFLAQISQPWKPIYCCKCWGGPRTGRGDLPIYSLRYGYGTDMIRIVYGCGTDMLRIRYAVSESSDGGTRTLHSIGVNL